MIAARDNPDFLGQDLVDEAVFLVDASGPTSGQLVLERFWFTNTGEGIVLRVSDEPENANRLRTIPFGPPCQVLERSRVELDTSHNPSFATASSSDTPPVRSSAASRRSRMGSDFNRYAVSRSEAISLHSAIGTRTAVGSPASLDTIWISTSATLPF